ncbi:MAG: serine hydrolase [Pseudomonadota bacterium]
MNSHLRLRFSTLVLMTALAHSFASTASAAERELTAASIQQFFDTAFSVQRQEHEIVGAVVSVVHDGKVLFKAGYGFADLEARVPADPDRSLFRIASITKTFVWTATMQLVEQGRLDLDDPVQQHIDFPIPDTFDEPIRVWHLLTHTPGFEDLNVGTSVRRIEDVPSTRDFLMSQMPQRVRPTGEQASYSNYGTALAGYVIERISGQSWSDYVDAQILEPLGMASTNTQLGMPAALRQRHAKGYRYAGERFEATKFDYFGDTAAGHMSTTAADMTRFMLAHLNEGAYDGRRILRAETARQMHSPLFAPHPAIPPMLHGFYRADRGGIEMFGHGGDTNQFHSQLLLVPGERLGLFVSFNSDPGATARSRLTNAFVDHFFGTPFLPAAPADNAFEQPNLQQYAGSYLPLRRNQSNFERLAELTAGVTVDVSDNQLRLSGARSGCWLPLGHDLFRAQNSTEKLVFTRTDDGDVSHMLVSSPLGSMERVSGLASPRVQQICLVLVAVAALLALLRYTGRAFGRAADGGLPRSHLIAACGYGLLVLGSYGYLARALTGNTDEFLYGVPTGAHVAFIAMLINALLAVLIVLNAVTQWRQQLGTLAMRLGYSLLALTALLSLWIGYYFNLLSYLFR